MRPKEQYDLDLDGEINVQKPKKTAKSKRSSKQEVWFYIGVVGNIGYSLVLPIVGGALLGSYVDRQWSTYPKATLVLLGIGCVIAVGVFKHTMAEILHRKN
jgi:ATP synthase protein I